MSDRTFRQSASASQALNHTAAEVAYAAQDSLQLQLPNEHNLSSASKAVTVDELSINSMPVGRSLQQLELSMSHRHAMHSQAD